jgi:hypothetical protein
VKGLRRCASCLRANAEALRSFRSAARFLNYLLKEKTMKKVLAIILFTSVAFSAACQSTCQKMERDGGVIGTYPGDWIVVKYSGGRITDVWKLENVLVHSEEGSDGWLFIDKNNSAVSLGGDVKAIRVKDRKTAGWDKYYEYHAEFEFQTYHEKHTPTPKIPTATSTPAAAQTPATK